MVVPTISVLSFSAVVMAALLAADWYVWGMTYAKNLRKPMQPCGETLEIAGTAHDEGQGFRKVA